MQKQKLKIQYQRDGSLHSMRANCQEKTGDIISFPLNLQNSHLAKRNKVQSKTKDLEKLIFKYKVKKLTTNFIKKTRLNSIHRKPCQTQENHDELQSIENGFSLYLKNRMNKFSQNNGLNIGNFGLILWSFINIFQITCMVFIFSIMMTFEETQNFSIFLYFRTFSILLYVIDMALNFTVMRYQGGKYLQKIKDISWFYVRNGFSIDLISILIFPIDILVNSKTNVTIFISFVAVIKLVNNIKKFEKFEYLFINSSQKQHYYGLIKVFLTNFAIGHFLSIFLNLMASLDDTENWRIKMNLLNAQWYVKYIWGYYWGTNIMLTVGFGDIYATNYYQAIVLVFIETFSCITLAYNINNVGALISSIRENTQAKKKKLKVFHRMCKQNFVSNQMQSKITNFIQESYRIKQSFEYDAHDEVLKSLPKILERQYRKQANKSLFDNLGFLSNLSKKTLLKLAEEISRKICHPEEVIIRKGAVSDFMVLQNGCLSLTCRVLSILDGKQIQTIEVKQQQKPKILSLDFIKNKTVNYNIKSNSYAVLYYLNREDLMQALRSSEMDFQMFCMIKDKDDNQIDSNNLYLCSVCKTEYHNKFQCNRLHYVPLKRNIFLKHVHLVNKLKQKRQKGFNRKKIMISSLFSYDLLQKDQKRYIEEHFDIQHYEQIQHLREFYDQINKQTENTSTYNAKQVKTFKSQFFQSTKTHFKGLIDEKALLKLEEIFENKANKMNGFWEFQIDEAHNFNFYFSQGNPQYLKKNKKSKRSKGFLNIYF